MKVLNRLQYAFAAGLVSAALVTSAAADVIPVKPEEGSQHFAAVAKHLELGGLFFTYADVEGDLAALGTFGDRLMDLARKQGVPLKKGYKASAVIEATGLTCVKAVGMSSRKLGPDMFHNRALLYMPEGAKGLLKMFGGKSAPFQVTSFAPADAGMATQMEVHLSALLDTIEAMLKATGEDQVLAQWNAVLSFPVPGLQMNAGELIRKLNTRIMVSLRIDERKKLSVPGAPVEVPGIEVMVGLDDVDFLMQPLLAMLGENDAVSVEKGDGFTAITPNAPMPGDLSYFKPALYYDQKSKRIILTSHLELAKSAGKGETLGGSEVFKKAMAGLPAEGNGMSYVTPQCMKAIMDAYTGIMDAAMKAGGSGSEVGGDVMKLLFSMFPAASAPVASVSANVPEGMLFTSNDTSNHKFVFEVLAAMPVVVLVAGAVGGYTAVMEKARPRAEAARPRPRQLEREEGNAAPAKAVKSNLDNIVFAAQTYFLDKPKEKEVTYEALVKSELIFDLDPVAGESYKGLTLKRGGGEVSVKLKGGNSISVKYQATAD